MSFAAYYPAEQPLDVDLGCGKGRFLLARAVAYPARNFLGIERMLRRVRKVDRQIQRRGLANVRLMRIEAYYAVAYLMPPRAVSTYYLFFPDPWPKRRHHGHRLFNPRFMDALDRTMLPGARLHVATDEEPYHRAISRLLAEDGRFGACQPFVPAPEEQTDFERYYVGRSPVYRISVERKGEVSVGTSSAADR